MAKKPPARAGGLRPCAPLVSQIIRPEIFFVTRGARAATYLLSPGIAAMRPRGDAPRPAGRIAAMDLLESLAHADVPPVPAASEFTAGVRRKLHPRLLAAHVAGFALQALPWAAVQFVTARP